MTRGKHGPSAAARKIIGERDQQIEAYQHNIRKLTAENAELKQKLVEQQAAHNKTVQVLKAQRDEGLSPMLSALQRENQRLQEDLITAEAGFGAMRTKFLQMIDKFAGHFRSSHGLTALEAIEETNRFFGDIEAVWQPGDYKQARKISTHAARALERARGDRQ